MQRPKQTGSHALSTWAVNAALFAVFGGQILHLLNASVPVWRVDRDWVSIAIPWVLAATMLVWSIVIVGQSRAVRMSPAVRHHFRAGLLSVLAGMFFVGLQEATAPELWVGHPLAVLYDHPMLWWGAACVTFWSWAIADTLHELRRAQYERDSLQAVLEFSETVSLSDEAQVLAATVNGLRELTTADAVVVYLLDTRDQLLRVAAHYHSPTVYDQAYVAKMISFACPPGHGITGLVMQSGEPVLVKDTSMDTRVQYPGLDAKVLAKTSLALPMKVRGRLVGVLRLTKGGVDQFTETHVAVASIFANHAAVTLEAGKLYHQVLGDSRTDRLTGLPNARAVHEMMEQAVRNRQPFALLMIDADALKPVNDRLGHQAGDRLIIDLAQSVQEAAQGAGKAFRYAGDEFLMVLPGASREDALAVGERICATRANARVETETGPIATTVSVGVAGYPSDGESVESLLAAADRAMYASKQSGKNRVSLAG